MKAITLQQPGTFQHIEINEPPPPSAGQALVQSHRMGICGTDYSCYLGKFPFFDYPRIPGHELGVEVLEVGPGVTNVKPGDLCSVEPYLNCGECFPCRRGKTNCCESLSVIGIMEDGGLCERFTIRADKLHPSQSLSCEQLALVETLAIGRHATARANPQAKDNVLIIGAGPIGLSTLEFTRLTGANITVMDMAKSRLEFCRATYEGLQTIHFTDEPAAKQQVHDITNGDRFAVVYDATGSPHSMAAALDFVAHSGTLVYVGVTTSNVSFAHPRMHKPEMSILSSRNALPAEFTEIIQLIENGSVNTTPWITHRTSFENVGEEFEAFTKPESGVIKAVIEVTP